MDKKHEKLMTDLGRLLDTQKFKSIEEINEFMSKFMDEPIPSFPPEALTDEEKAQDLVFAAYEEKNPTKSMELIMEALMLDHDCIEAFEYMGEQSDFAPIATAFYEKGISIGRVKFGGKFMKENKGHFWAMHETRPFMRCLNNYADCLYTLGKFSESIAIQEEMIKLNPNDNQGVRDLLMLRLIHMNERAKFLKYDKMFNDHLMAFPLYNRALYWFMTEGETENSNEMLKKALNANKFAAAKLLLKRDVKSIPDLYSPGQKSEGDYYAYFAKPVWENIEGALEWLKKHAGKK